MRAAGKTDSETTTALKAAGWPEADILAAVDSETQPPSLVSPTKLKSKTWFWVLIVLAAIGFGSYLTLRILPYILAWSLKRQGETSITYTNPAADSESSNLNQTSSVQPIKFPNNIIQFTIPNSWYTKKEMGGQNSYQMQFAYKADSDESEDYPEYTMQVTVTYPAGQSSEMNNLEKIVTVLRSSFNSAVNDEKVKAAESALDLSENLQSITNETNLPGKFNLLVDQPSSVAGLSGHMFEYTNEISKVVNKKEKEATGKFVETTTNVHRVEHVRDLIIFDRKNNLIVISFKATDSSWLTRVGDFNKITSSLAILYK